MRVALRTLVAVVAGMALALVLVMAVEWFSAIVHPIPADLEDNIPEHVRRYPHWILAVVVLAWGATIAAATWVASRLGNHLAGGLVALLLGAALVFNLTMLPYAIWFKIVMFVAFPIVSLIGINYGRRSPSAVARADAAPLSAP